MKLFQRKTFGRGYMLDKPYTQSEEYFNLLTLRGKKPFYIKVNNSFALMLKEYKYFKGIKIPFFYKLTSIDTPIFDNNEDFNEIIKMIESLTKSIFCVKAQIETNPKAKLPQCSFFNSSKFTYLLDLKDISNEDEYMAILNGKVRNIVRRSLKQGLTIRQIENEDDLELYINIRNENRRMNNLADIDKNHFIENWRMLGIYDNLRYFIVFQDDIPLVGQEIIISDNCFNLAGVSTSRKVYEMKLNANDFMQFHIVKMAIDEKIRFIDWGGAQPNSEDFKMQAIDKFKAKWGGKLIEYPVYLKGY